MGSPMLTDPAPANMRPSTVPYRKNLSPVTALLGLPFIIGPVLFVVVDGAC